MDDMYNVMPDNIRSIDELEDWKNRFLSMPYRIQLQSDDMSIGMYGKTNMDRYYNKKSSLMYDNFNDVISKGIDDQTDNDINTVIGSEDVPVDDIDSSYIESVIRLSNIMDIIPSTDSIKSIKEDVNNKYDIIYVVLFSNDSTISKLIKFWTKSEFSHCAIGFDKKLEKIYSFAQSRDGEKSRVGFVQDDIHNYHDMNIKVYAIAIPYKAIYYIKKTIKDYIDHMASSSYNVLAILSILINKQLKLLMNRYTDKYNMICSQFVYTILTLCNIHMNINKRSYQVTPKDINTSLEVKQNVIDSIECKISTYDYKKFYRSIKSNIHTKDIILDESGELDLQNTISDDTTEYSYTKDKIIPIDIDDNILSRLKDIENDGMYVLLSDLDNFKDPSTYNSKDIDTLNDKYNSFSNLSTNMRKLCNTSVQSILNIDNINLYKNILADYCRRNMVNGTLE